MLRDQLRDLARLALDAQTDSRDGGLIEKGVDR
jgi:hypothetical protein